MKITILNRVLYRSKPLLIAIAVLFCLAALYRLGSWGVIDTSEARYSEISRQMYESGDFLHPVYLGIEHYHKPHLTYQITAIAYGIFGTGTFGARILLQLALVVQILLIWMITRDVFGDVHKATIGALMYCSFFIVWIASRNLTTDAYLATFLLATIWAMLRYAKRATPGYLYIAAGMAALAFLTKITASLVILGPVVLAIYWIHRKTWKWSWHLLPAIALYVAISLSWFLILESEGKHVLKYLLYDHSVVRYATDSFGRNKPFYLYLLAVPILGFPWVIMLFQAFIAQWRARTVQLESWLLMGAWCVFPIIFYSISHSKLILYVLPAFAAIAILGPHHIALLKPRIIKMWLKIQLGVYALLIAGFLTYPLYTELEMEVFPQVTLVVLLVVSLLVALLYGTISLRMRMALISVVFVLFAAMIGTHVMSGNERHISTTKPVAEWLKSENLQNRNIFIFDRLAPSLSFHLRQPTAMIATGEKRELQFENNDDWKAHYFNLDRSSDVKRLNLRMKDPSVLVILRKLSAPQNLLYGFSREIEIGKWKVYY